jgi:hypothetical protein
MGDIRALQRRLLFEARMKNMLLVGYAGVGHSLTYKEAIWWGQNANGATLRVDGNTIDTWKIPLTNRVIAWPIFDNTRVYGSVSVNPANGLIYYDRYDYHYESFQGDNPAEWAITALRNTLNFIGEIQNSGYTPYTLAIEYNAPSK